MLAYISASAFILCVFRVLIHSFTTLQVQLVDNIYSEPNKTFFVLNTLKSTFVLLDSLVFLCIVFHPLLVLAY